jgi:hypothetical protein
VLLRILALVGVMSDDKIRIHIDPSEIDPAIPQTDRCPDHPGLEPEMGFGLAGGGYALVAA